MMKTESAYDILIIGAGQAGIPLARSLAGAGQAVAIAERTHLGGSCVNFGCTPTKAVIASARIAHLARRAADFGVIVSDVSIDYARVLARALSLVDDAKKSLAKGLDECDADVLIGHCRFVGRSRDLFKLTVDERDVLARQVVIDTGTRTQVPAIEGLNKIDYLHSGNWLEHRSLPDHVIFAGAGYIALEMAQFYRRMGARVTVVGSGEQVADHEDQDISAALQKFLESEGIAFLLRSKVTSVAKTQDGVVVTASSANRMHEINGSHLFLATGRKPNTDDLGLETIGLPTRDDGTIEIDDRLATKVKGVWAAGDIRGGPMFTHTSWDDHRVLESQLLRDGSRTIAERIVPYAIFTDPELGRVGMTEAEARKQHGDLVTVATYEMKSNGKASEVGESEGFIKLIANVETGELFGAAILTLDGAELVGSFITLMNAKATLDAICRGIYIHPTLSEAVQSAAMKVTLKPKN